MTDAPRRQDIYDRVTSKIIEFLEAGASLTDRLWASGAPGLPLRSTNAPYRGVNTVLLWCAAAERGFDHRHWLTYKNAANLGGQVRKGEKGELVVYADQITKTVQNDAGEPEERKGWFWKGYTVFNASQIDRLPAAFYDKPKLSLMDKPERLIAVDTFIRHTKAKFVEGGTRAFYRPAADEIHVPELAKFKDRESYAAVALHELTHWTGAQHRLDRLISTDMHSTAYAKEELVAEVGSAFLCASLEITPHVREDHAGYLAAWLKVLKSDNRAIFAAAGHAQKAADYLFSLQPR